MLCDYVWLTLNTYGGIEQLCIITKEPIQIKPYIGEKGILINIYVCCITPHITKS